MHIVSSSPSGDIHISFRLAVWFHFEEVGALVQILACELIRRSLAEDKVLRVVAMCCMCNVHTFTRRVVRFTGSYIHTCNSRSRSETRSGRPEPSETYDHFPRSELGTPVFFRQSSRSLKPGTHWRQSRQSTKRRQIGDKVDFRLCLRFVAGLSKV